ncbi:hypothetical protein ASG01_03445 [Chryseobacterium sp. Leaf180]|uniref:DUF3298 and DUF4163 domain-containing protein n=1 Tax=Chryseobacterium sp. Leaf180 TaxID=1736289 RepID=UPI000700B90A|nr:DUF3298 and DUF4163 domain-containing protein [Chryseobacterium sp. Leaf180]KQR94931.1 hypothetical protein ASG01_03445 [Chryseobacterium sp. Leaf180]
MKNSILIFGLIASVMATSCKKTTAENKNETVEISVAKKFAIDSVKVNDSVKINYMLSASYTATFLVFPDLKDKALLDSIYDNKKGITDFSVGGLKSYLEKDKNEYFDSVKKDYGSENQDFNMELYSGWEMSLISQKNDYLQIENLYSSYEGGAHGNYVFDDRVFDLKMNKKLQLQDITTMPTAMLSALLKKNLNKLPSGTTDSQGAVNNSDMLLVEVIPPNRSFYFDDKNLYFHYSPYEIAAYAAGDIIIPIAWEDLKGTLTDEFRERMKIK